MFPDAPEPFIDLSTGINPYPYPLPALPPEIFARLPDRASVRRLAVVAAHAYGAPSADHVLPAPGTQILLPAVAALMPQGRAAILRTTYAEHARAAKLAGHRVSNATDCAELSRSDMAVVVNPNNPDGRVVARNELLDLADRLRARGGILIVDESFADVVSPGTSLAGDVGHGNIVVLRSFGKFFGLAGLRLGFAIAATDLIGRLDAVLGPGPLQAPRCSSAKRPWPTARGRRTRFQNSRKCRNAWMRCCAKYKLEPAGGTILYRLTHSPDAGALFEHLGRAGIMVRRFAEDSTLLRWGLPGSDEAWGRLQAALGAFN